MTAIRKGAQNVVASLWRVNDYSTSLLMAEFYRALARDGLTPVNALRYAQINMLRGLIPLREASDAPGDRNFKRTKRPLAAQLENPYHWGGFTVTVTRGVAVMVYVPHLEEKLERIFQHNRCSIRNKTTLLEAIGLHRNAFNRWAETP